MHCIYSTYLKMPFFNHTKHLYRSTTCSPTVLNCLLTLRSNTSYHYWAFLLFWKITGWSHVLRCKFHIQEWIRTYQTCLRSWILHEKFYCNRHRYNCDSHALRFIPHWLNKFSRKLIWWNQLFGRTSCKRIDSWVMYNYGNLTMFIFIN